MKAIGLSNNFNDGRWSQSLNFTTATNAASKVESDRDSELIVLAVLNLDSATSRSTDDGASKADYSAVASQSVWANQQREETQQPLTTDVQLSASTAGTPVAADDSSSGESIDSEIDVCMANAEAVAELLLSSGARNISYRICAARNRSTLTGKAPPVLRLRLLQSVRSA